MLLAHGFSSSARPTVVGHSYGCFMARWLVAPNPHVTVGGCVLTDPLVFLTVFPEISRNVVLDVPRTPYLLAKEMVAGTESIRGLIRKAVLREPGIAKCFNRHSFWHNVIMWDDDFGAVVQNGTKVAVFLSRLDEFLPAPKTFEYLTKSPRVPRGDVLVKICNGGHGDFMLSKTELENVGQLIDFVRGRKAGGGGGGGR